MPNGTQDRRPGVAGPDFDDARSFVHALHHQTQGYVEKRRADAARIVWDVGDAIRATGTNFDGLPRLKAFFDQAALSVDELAEDISRHSFSEMYDEVHAAVRRRPTLATAAVVLAGFALFRALRTPQVRPVPRSHALVPVDVFPTPDV